MNIPNPMRYAFQSRTLLFTMIIKKHTQHGILKTYSTWWQPKWGSNLVLNTNFVWYVMASVSYDYRHQEYLQEHQEFLDRLEASRLRIQRTQRWHFLTGLFVSPFYRIFEQPYCLLKHVYSSVLRIF